MRGTTLGPFGVGLFCLLGIYGSLDGCVGTDTTVTPDPTDAGPAATGNGGGADAAATSDGGSPAPSPGTNAYETSFTDFPLVIADASATFRAVEGGPSGFTAHLSVYLRSTTGICADLEAHTQKPSSNRLDVEIEKACSSLAGCAVEPGSYAVTKTDGLEVKVERVKFDGQCGATGWTSSLPASVNPKTSSLTVNKIILTTSTATHVAGTYELRNGADFIKGSFDTDICTAPHNTSSPLCK